MNNSDKTVFIVDTGVANVASVQAAFARLNWETQLTQSAATISEAAFVVLPGVGSFSAGISRLHELGIVEPLKRRINDRQSTLAICLGMQLLCRSSDEAPETDGLGIFETTAIRFPSDLLVPQLGWNTVKPSSDTLFQPGVAYFANSYCVPAAPPGWETATTHYGIDFVSASWSGPVLACQFHPELSSHWGQQLLTIWLNKMQTLSPTETSASC